ncbi:hypothetical protein J6590_008143 [Homalodisca vitripennis]|nr:hypothetical protein J6590_008143 [Homalodisca vitripennis]
MVMSPWKKRNPTLNQPLQSKRAGGGIPPTTPTVISRSTLELSNYPCAPESRHFRHPYLSDKSVFAVPSVGSTRYKPARTEPSWHHEGSRGRKRRPHGLPEVPAGLAGELVTGIEGLHSTIPFVRIIVCPNLSV